MLSTRESYVTTARHQVTPYLSRCNSALLGCQDLVPHSHADESHLALCGCNPGVNSGCDALVVFLFHLHRCAFDKMKGEHAGSISAREPAQSVRTLLLQVVGERKCLMRLAIGFKPRGRCRYDFNRLWSAETCGGRCTQHNATSCVLTGSLQGALDVGQSCRHGVPPFGCYTAL